MHKKSRGLSVVMPTCHMVSCNFSVVVGSSTYMSSPKSFGPFPTMSEKIEATIFDYLYFLDVPIVFPFVSELQRSERIGQDTNKVVPVFCRDKLLVRLANPADTNFLITTAQVAGVPIPQRSASGSVSTFPVCSIADNRFASPGSCRVPLPLGHSNTVVSPTTDF